MKEIFSVLTSPKATFESIRERGGAFAIPFIFLLVGTLLALFLQLPVIEANFDASLLPDGTDVEAAKQVSLIIGIIFAVIIMAGTVFVSGLLLMLVNLVIRGEAKYMQLVKVAVLSSMPGLLSQFLIGILARTMDANTVSGINLSLGALFEDRSGFLYALANLVNPFDLWGLAIMAIGTAVMARRATKRAAVWVVGGWIVISLLFAFIGGSLV